MNVCEVVETAERADCKVQQLNSVGGCCEHSGQCSGAVRCEECLSTAETGGGFLCNDSANCGLLDNQLVTKSLN